MQHCHRPSDKPLSHEGNGAVSRAESKSSDGIGQHHRVDTLTCVMMHFSYLVGLAQYIDKNHANDAMCDDSIPSDNMPRRELLL